jgi:SAM-dependent methyltransferase
MGFWTDHVVPRITDAALDNRDIRQHRERVVAGLRGTVLEIGFGSGLNVPVYPPEVERVLAVEPSMLGRKRGEERIAASPVEIEFVGLDGQSIPLPDDSVDAALTTFTLCTIPDVDAALAEVRRVLKPGGELHFLEHGLSPEPGVARWQHRLDGFEQRIAGGCHLIRPTDRLLRDAGFEIRELTEDEMAGPKLMAPWAHLYQGVATAP